MKSTRVVVQLLLVALTLGPVAMPNAMAAGYSAGMGETPMRTDYESVNGNESLLGAAHTAEVANIAEGRALPSEAVPLLKTTSNAALDLVPTSVEDLPSIAQVGWNYDPTSAYDQKGLFQPRGFQAGAPTETIDPFSGNLLLVQTDLNLPGVAGLDVTLQRVYNSKIHRNYAAIASGDPNRIATGILFVPTSPIGLGWTLHMGRLVGAVNGGPNNALAGPRYYERSDGSQHPFFQYSGEGCGDETNDTCLLTKQFDNPYQVEPGMPWHIATANGLNITFDHTAFDGASVVNYATEIRDVNGNTIQIAYHDDTIPGIAYPRDYFRHFIDRIIDSAGRVIQFGYSEVHPGTVRLTSITAVGRTMRYVYSADDPWPGLQAFLTRVEPPAGGVWHYEYAGIAAGTCANNAQRWCELTQVTFPTGGVIDYTFEQKTFWAQTNPVTVRAVTARAMSGPLLDDAAWTYEYNRAADYAGSEHTVITRPDGSQEISTFFGIGAGQYNPLGLAWKTGVLLQKRIRSTQGEIVQSETYDWVRGSKISDEIWGDPWLGFDTGVYLPRLRERVIRRGNLSWTTTHTTFNDSNNTPRCVMESGDGATRYRLQAFFSDSQLVEQGDYQFRIVGRPGLKMLSYNAFSADACNDDLEDVPIAPAVGDEFETRQYDSLGRVANQMINSVYTEYHYNANGTQASAITFQTRDQAGQYSNGICSTFSNYQYGEPGLIQYGGIGAVGAPTCSAFLLSEQRTINVDGSIASQTNGAGQTTLFEYDGLGRLASVQPPGVAEIEIAFDGGNSTRTSTERIDQGSYWLERRLDGFGRVVEEESAAGVAAGRAYDAMGQLAFQSAPVEVSDPDALDSAPGTSFTYDALGRTIEAVQPDGTTTTYSYGVDQNIVTMSTELAGVGTRVTVHARQAFADPDDAWLMRVQLPGEAMPESDMYTYLVGGHIASVSFGGREYALTYNYAKRVVAQLSPETGVWTYYGYDATGKLRCRSLGDNSRCFNDTWGPDAQVYYEVDRLGRTTKVQYNGGSPNDVSMFYNPDDSLNRIVDGAGTHTFTYLPGGRIQTQSSTINGVTYVTAYTYTELGDVETITYPAGRVVTYEYDAARRVMRVPGFVNAIEYYPSGLMRRLVYGNGVETTLSLDSRLQPDRLRAPNVLDLDYDFDAAGNLTALTDRLQTANSATFDYDDLDRLVAANGVWGSLTFAYNAGGDRTQSSFNGQTTTYAYDEQANLDSSGLLTGIATTGGASAVDMDYQYDGNGNVIVRGGLRYVYDAENRLTNVSDTNNESLLTNVYNGQGQRVKALWGGCERALIYHYDQFGNRIAESTDDGLMLKEMIYSGGQAIAELNVNPLRLDAPIIDFGEVETGATLTKDVVVTNRSSAAMTIQRVVLDAPYTVDTTLPLAIPANSSRTLAMNFRPTDEADSMREVALCDQNGIPLYAAVMGQGVNAISEYGAAPNSIDASANEPVSVTFRQPVVPASVNEQSFVVHAMQLGQLLSIFNVAGTQIRLSPTSSLRAGEQINVTVTTDISYAGGGGPGAARVFQFWVGPRRSSGQFDSVATRAAVEQEEDNTIVKIALGDLDGDGDLDAFVARGPAQPNQVWFNDGSGSFTDSGQSLGNFWSEDVALGDFDGDGDLDAFVANAGTNAITRSNRIYTNDGNGVFSESAQLASNDETRAVALGDLDGDGDLDAVIANSDVAFTPGYSPINRIYLNDGAGNFVASGALGSGRTMDVAIGDVDNDGDLDVFLVNFFSDQQSYVYLNEGDATFRGGQTLDVLSQSVMLGDIDGDGDLDAMLGSVLFRNDGTGTFTQEGALLDGSAFANLQLSDVDGDGDLDVYVDQQGGADAVWLNNGAGVMSNSGQSIAGSALNVAALGDLDGDRDIDVLLAPNAVGMNRNGVPSNRIYLPKIFVSD